MCARSMNATTYRDGGISFEPPRGWVDKTMVAFAAPGSGLPATSNLVLTSEPFREGDSLRTHVGRQILEASRQLKNFELIETNEGMLGGLPAMCLRFTWTTYFGELEQTITSVERILDGTRVVTSVTTTATIEHAEEARAAFEAFLASVRFSEVPGEVRVSQSEIRTKHEAPPEMLPPLIPMPGLGRIMRAR
jgi:hypothetical protein